VQNLIGTFLVANFTNFHKVELLNSVKKSDESAKSAWNFFKRNLLNFHKAEWHKDLCRLVSSVTILGQKTTKIRTCKIFKVFITNTVF